VMGFATDEEYAEFLETCPAFEEMLVRSGTILVKYWFSVSDAEQERRFQDRINDPSKRWKLSPMDLEARSRWVEFSKAKDEMFGHTDTDASPWWVVESDDKRRAHLNSITHLLSQVPYEELPQQQLTLPPRQPDSGYVRPPRSSQRFVPEVW
jgi:polyphosphate kinase